LRCPLRIKTSHFIKKESQLNRISIGLKRLVDKRSGGIGEKGSKNGDEEQKKREHLEPAGEIPEFFFAPRSAQEQVIAESEGKDEEENGIGKVERAPGKPIGIRGDITLEEEEIGTDPMEHALQICPGSG